MFTVHLPRKRSVIILFFILANSFVHAQEPLNSGSINVNGKSIYYETYGSGEPLVFLHGYGLSSQSWKSYVASFEKDYRVYLIDLPGHGKSSKFMEDLSFRDVAADVNQVLVQLGLSNVKAIGFSFGADILFQLALINPKMVDSMVSVGSAGSWDINDFPELKKTFTYANRDKFPWLVDSQSNEEQVKLVLEQFQNYTVYLTDEQLQHIRARVLIVSGDNDPGVDLQEVARLKAYLPQCDIWILPHVGHSAHTGENKSDFVEKSLAFLAGK